MAFPDMGNMKFNGSPDSDEDDDDEDDDENNQKPPIFAGAIPLGSIFGNLNNFKQNNGQDETSSGSNVKKKVKPEKKKSANKRK